MKDFTVDGYAFFHFEVDTGALLFLGCVFNRSPKAELSVSWYLWYRVFLGSKMFLQSFFQILRKFYKVWVRLRWLETGIFFHLCRDLDNFLRYTWLLLNFCLMALNFAEDFFFGFWFWIQRPLNNFDFGNRTFIVNFNFLFFILLSYICDWFPYGFNLVL